MSKEKQIEEREIEKMAKIIETTEQIARDAHCGLPSPRMYAKDLYWHGYREQSEWISVEERLPDPETEVLVLAVRRYKYGKDIQEVTVITTAMYEDGTISNEDSVWNWYDIDFIYDEENDIEYVPEGWWEFRHYNPDDVYNNAVDDKVTHWIPLPEAPKMKGGAEE